MQLATLVAHILVAWMMSPTEHFNHGLYGSLLSALAPVVTHTHESLFLPLPQRLLTFCCRVPDPWSAARFFVAWHSVTDVLLQTILIITLVWIIPSFLSQTTSLRHA
jgi:hypothetical protein